MKRILTIFGTRPEAIKFAPVIRELNRHPEDFISRVCVTAQHREMLDQVLTTFEILPDIDLDIMRPGQNLAQLTARAIEGLEQVIAKEKPDVILVQGDTTTAFCGALAAYYNRVPVGHIEAGLRTGNKYAPFPEETNRRLVAPLTAYHFAPTDLARNALLKENIPESTIFVTGNTVIDSLLWMHDKVKVEQPTLPTGLAESLDGRPMILVTGHRRESFGDGFKNICAAIREIVENFSEVAIVYPVHLNPNVLEPVKRILGGHARINLVEPMDYEPFVWLMDRATIILTDSGGIQEEAPSLGKPVLVMRETTERQEGIEAGNARLVGVQKSVIVDEVSRLLNKPSERKEMTSVQNPYGDGQAAKKIVEILAKINVN